LQSAAYRGTLGLTKGGTRVDINKLEAMGERRDTRLLQEHEDREARFEAEQQAREDQVDDTVATICETGNSLLEALTETKQYEQLESAFVGFFAGTDGADKALKDSLLKSIEEYAERIVE